MSGLGNKHILVRDWERQKWRYTQRLGKFFAAARVRAGETRTEVIRQSHEFGQPLNKALLSRLETLADDDPNDPDEVRRPPDLLTTIYLSLYYNTSPADMWRYLATGELRAPGEQQRAEVVSRAFLALPEPERMQLEQYADFLMQQATARAFDPDAADEDDTPRQPRRTSHRPNAANEMARLDATRRAVAYAETQGEIDAAKESVEADERRERTRTGS